MASWSGDVWGGLASMLVALPSSVAYGVVVYSALGSEYAGAGALAGAVGAGALGMVASFTGRSAGLISAPCAPAAAVLAALAAELLGNRNGPPIAPADVPALLGLTGLLAAALQMIFGLIGGGHLIKYIPYPVVSGYMSGVGAIIALGQLPKLFGLPKGMPLGEGLVSPAMWEWQGLIVGTVTIVLMGLTPRFMQKAPAAIVGLGAGALTYFILSVFDPSLMTLQGNSLVIGPLELTGSFLEGVTERTALLAHLADVPIRLILIPAATLSVLLSIDTLKTCVVLDAVTRSRHDSNRVLIGQGAGNAVAFLAGGMPGAGTMGPTLVNVTSGGRTIRSGIFEGAFVMLALVLASRWLAWLPIGALAGILLVVAWKMLDKNAVRLLRYPAGRLDFAVIATVAIVAVSVGLIAASAVGVACAIFLFIRAQMQGTVLRHKRYLNQVSSNTRRLAEERGILDRRGGECVFCELQGDLFFGTTDKLLSLLDADLRSVRYILFDMRRVQSMDYTAAHLLGQMQAQLEERGGRLLFSGMPSAHVDRRDFEHDLARLDVIRDPDGALVVETLDGALEWMEERILDTEPGRSLPEERILGLEEIPLFEGLDVGALQALSLCIEEMSTTAGGRIVASGDAGDEIFFIRRGRVQVLLPLEGGRRHHVATFGAGDFFGEIGFLDQGVRSAIVEAKVATELYVLSRARFDEKSQANGPGLAGEVFARLARAIASRLRQADSELRTLEDR